MADKSYQLVVRKGPRPGEVFSLTLDTVMIGRDPLTDIVINDPEVSRHHAQLKRTATGYQIKDLGSTNGTFVDGKRIGGEPVDLSPGQVVMVGSNVAMVFQATSGADPLATMIAPRDMPRPGDVPEIDVPEPSFPEADPRVTREQIPDPQLSDEEPVTDFEEEESPETAAVPDWTAWTPEEVEESEGPVPVVDDAVDYLSGMDEPQPSFRRDEPEPSPSFEAEPGQTSSFEGEPPPASPPAGGRTGGGMNRNVIITAVIVILLCCCCLALIGLYLAIEQGAFQLDHLPLRGQWFAIAADLVRQLS